MPRSHAQRAGEADRGRTQAAAHDGGGARRADGCLGWPLLHSVVHGAASRPEHPDIPGARWVLLARFPYVAFYTVKEAEGVIVALEHASRDYIDRVVDRIRIHRRRL